MQLKILFL